MEIANLLRHCRALIFPGIEDFGIAPLEAMASGRPVIGFALAEFWKPSWMASRGDSFYEPTAESLGRAVLEFEENIEGFNSKIIRAHAEKFGRVRFSNELKAAVARQFEKSPNGLRRSMRNQEAL